jgi:multidrug efflux pump subunit AcrB
MNRRRESGCERFREGYGRLLAAAQAHRPFALIVSALIGVASAALIFLVGTDFFPDVIQDS